MLANTATYNTLLYSSLNPTIPDFAVVKLFSGRRIGQSGLSIKGAFQLRGGGGGGEGGRRRRGRRESEEGRS
ncbi:hypothetical protein P389DRAFT_171234 [Cystobasidium minutum MCA 4210]|uniref:uncharacterized protein n=1 Tax=Cystobasidium minutum MCA 4210 TaxID=1397322 RepID=UPI0034CD208C|eukprot:jgi/Rhomi1/171234/fgenesh1_kg.4_\